MDMACTICSELAGRPDPYLGESYKKLIESNSNILLDTENFVVLPSVGALNPSHVLVVPKEHVCNFAMLPHERLVNEFPQIYYALRNFNQSKGVSVVFFEHGMGSIFDTSGACVSHAHLHVIANEEPLESNLRNSIKLIDIPSFDLISCLASKEAGYVVFGNASGNVGIANRPDLPPQFFRRIYAITAKNPAVWNWRIDRQPLYTKQVIAYYTSLDDVYLGLTEQVK
jgi:ATP adenylyltransferase